MGRPVRPSLDLFFELRMTEPMRRNSFKAAWLREHAAIGPDTAIGGLGLKMRGPQFSLARMHDETRRSQETFVVYI